MAADAGSDALSSSVFSSCSLASFPVVPPDLSLVAVGSQRHGADWVLDTILGGGSFDWGGNSAYKYNTAEVNGKRVQLVRAPIWLRGYHLCDTAELVKQELVLSVARCHQAPRAFVLLVEVDFPFTSACARAIYAHLELFGKNVWRHTIVLFTRVDWLSSTSIYQFVAGEGEGLGELLRKCGGGFYAFDRRKTRQTLSAELLGRIEEMVRSNGGRCFEMEPARLQRLLRKRQDVRRRAAERRRRREQKSKERKAGAPVSEFTVILLGWVFAVKSRLSDAIVGSAKEPGRTERCVRRSAVAGHRTVTVVDTPGWWKFLGADLVPNVVKSEIAKAFADCQGAENVAVLLCVPVDTSFTDEQRRVLEDNMGPLGEKAWRNTVVVFTRGTRLGDYSVERHIESEGGALVWLVEKCGNRYFLFDGEKQQQDPDDTQVTDLLDMVEGMLCENQSLETESVAPAPPRTVAAAGEAAVDEDLKKMAAILYKVWGWRSWEVEEIKRRYAISSVQEKNDGSGNVGAFVLKKTYHSRKEMEDALRKETQHKSVAEVIEIALEIYFLKECGAFDIVSIICEKDTFKPEWKALFEREWSRREVRMKEHVKRQYFAGDQLPTDDGCLVDDIEPGPDVMLKVLRWLSSCRDEGATEEQHSVN